MKKIKSFIFASTLLLIITLFSCSQDNQLSPAANFTVHISTADLGKLKDEFLEIMKSDEYIIHENNCIEMAKALNGSFIRDQDLESSTAFENWLRSHISNTTFSSIENGLMVYNNVMASADDLNTRFKSFYDGLATLDVHDIVLILEPQLTFPALQTNSDPHSEWCMDEAEIALDNNENTFCDIFSNPNVNGAIRQIFRVKYWNDVQQIIDDFNDCMNYTH